MEIINGVKNGVNFINKHLKPSDTRLTRQRIKGSDSEGRGFESRRAHQ